GRAVAVAVDQPPGAVLEARGKLPVDPELDRLGDLERLGRAVTVRPISARPREGETMPISAAGDIVAAGPTARPPPLPPTLAAGPRPTAAGVATGDGEAVRETGGRRRSGPGPLAGRRPDRARSATPAGGLSGGSDADFRVLIPFRSPRRDRGLAVGLRPGSIK